VEMQSLSTDDFIRILNEPQNSLLKQYSALMETEGLGLSFSDAAVREICEIATEVNDRTENIGARRLHTILERVLEDISFEASTKRGEDMNISADYVRERVGALTRNEDLSRYIL